MNYKQLKARYFPKYKMIKFEVGDEQRFLLLERRFFMGDWTYAKTYRHNIPGMMCYFSNFDFTEIEERTSGTMIEAIKKYIRVQKELGNKPSKYTVVSQWASYGDVLKEFMELK